MTPREQAKALLLLQAWRRLVQDGHGNVEQLLAVTVEFLTIEIVEEIPGKLAPF